MAKPPKISIGDVFGELTVTHIDGTDPVSKHIRWFCKCSCGNTVSVRSASLRCGTSKSCGKCRSSVGPASQKPEAKLPTVEDVLVERGLRAKIKKLHEEKAALLKALDSEVERNSIICSLADRARLVPDPVNRPKIESGLREATAVVLASDWHCGLVVPSEKVAGLNEFNLEVFNRRVERFFSGVVWLVRHHRNSFKIRNLVLWLGGDLIEGYLREESLETSVVSPTMATRIVRSVLRDGIAWLLKELDLERLIVLCSYGNHGRIGEKKKISSAAENSHEHLMYLYLTDDFSDEERVEFVVSQGEHIHYTIYDLSMRFLHGDSIRYHGGVGGITVPLNRALLRWNTSKPCSYTNIGHFHSYFSGPRLTVNGSLCGYTPYALSLSCEYERPQQAFYIVDSRRGVCMHTPIWLDSDPELD